MRAVIMAGGFGTRMRPLTCNIPKPMTPLANRPIIERVVELLKRYELTDITVLLYYQPAIIREHLGDGSRWGARITYAVPTEDLGTAGAVRYALERSPRGLSDPALIISGDVVTDFDLQDAILWHQKNLSEATLLLTRRDNPLPYGIVITDESGRITKFLEKPSWGEAFSDTINTGVYLLEPTALEMIPAGKQYDFSQDLYPAMLAGAKGLYGKIASGYWRDIGNTDEYSQAHYDVLMNAVAVSLPGVRQETASGVAILEDGAVMAGSVEIDGAVVIGSGSKIGERCRIANSVVGPGVTIGPDTVISGSVIWEKSTVGADSEITSAVVCARCVIGDNVVVGDRCIVADDCSIERGATLKDSVKIWPGKTVEEGGTVYASLVWGERWNRELFTDSKVTGLALTEITPEMAVRLGAAFGAALGQGASVVTSRDASDTSRLIKRAFNCGLMAAGVHVIDLEIFPMPLVRFGVHEHNAAAGVYVRHNTANYRLLDLICIDRLGRDMSTGALKKIERLYSGEDYQRASIDDTGRLQAPKQILGRYLESFFENISVAAIQSRDFKLVVDYSNGGATQVLPTILTNLGLSPVTLNAYVDTRKISRTAEQIDQSLSELSRIVTSLHSDVGFHINTAAEKITVVDEKGAIIESQTLLLIVLDMLLALYPIRKIAVPVAASMGVEAIARLKGVEVVRVRNSHLAMMEVMATGQVDFVGGTMGGYIFSGGRVGADAMFSAVKILEMMALLKVNLSSLRNKYTNLVRKTMATPCPWGKKGAVMRALISTTEGKERWLIDGVRVRENGGYALIAPDRHTASFNIMVESANETDADHILATYRSIVTSAQGE